MIYNYLLYRESFISRNTRNNYYKKNVSFSFSFFFFFDNSTLSIAPSQLLTWKEHDLENFIHSSLYNSLSKVYYSYIFNITIPSININEWDIRIARHFFPFFPPSSLFSSRGQVRIPAKSGAYYSRGDRFA